MAFTAPTAKLEQIRKSMASLGSPEGSARLGILKAMRDNIRAVLKYEFSSSQDPSGNAWKDTVRGKPALRSKKLPNAFVSRLDRGVLGFVGKVDRGWLDAHQFGASMHNRSRLAPVLGNQFIRRAKAKQIYGRKKSKFRAGLSHRLLSANTHTLPARPIIPEGNTLPRLWEAAVSAGIAAGMQRWAEQVSK
jgi:hypothetical protein